MTTETPDTTAETNSQLVGDFFEVVAKVEEAETGVFDAPLNRSVARVLVDSGYRLNPAAERKATVNELFDILITVEHEQKGIFRASLARHTAQALVEAGCTR